MLLKEARETKNLSVEDLADQTGVGQTTISAIERGASRPTASTVRKLCDTLEVSSTEIAEFKNEFPFLKEGEVIGDPCPCGCGGVLEATSNPKARILPVSGKGSIWGLEVSPAAI